MSDTPNRTLAAFGAVLIYACVIAFTDNYVRVIARDAGLWQFHATRTGMAFAILALVAIPLGLTLRPRRPGAVLARSAIHGAAMVIYFGALAFLPVAQVAAGLFTAPIFVLLIQRFLYGVTIRGLQILAVIIGFLGVVLVLGPEAMSGATLAALLPVIAGALYAMGNIATRAWCAGESAETLVAGFFGMLGVIGLIGMAVLWVFPLPAPDGADGFLQRGPVWPTGSFLWWTFVQAAGSLLGVGMIVKAYQIAEASRVSVFEYVILPASAVWGLILWGERLTPVAIAGMGLIVVAGMLIARPQRTLAAGQSPTASRQ
ncbi:DMT family transporter [Tabrizicola sp.]|jgi:drug/metabolite transporter (DMT)-like permease|uniref:DMT family transporter n=1 Tax=Tabrizicola sp. TaxID=2005166 RepID=UPI0025E3C77D|nr:DMT family transporter [Tabrizicola sp.]MBY0349503.1 DMT family transporter [Tabrizicola sp.]